MERVANEGIIVKIIDSCSKNAYGIKWSRKEKRYRNNMPPTPNVWTCTEELQQRLQIRHSYARNRKRHHPDVQSGQESTNQSL